MADEIIVDPKTQKDGTGDEKTQTVEPQDTKQGEHREYVPPKQNDGESDADYYKRRAEAAEAHAKTRAGEAHHYRTEYQKIKNNGEQPQVATMKQVRVETLLNSIKDPNKRKLVEAEIGILPYGESPEEVNAAFQKALDVVEAPLLRQALQKRGQQHMSDLEIATTGGGSSYNNGDRQESTLHPEAQAIINEYKKTHKTNKK